MDDLKEKENTLSNNKKTILNSINYKALNKSGKTIQITSSIIKSILTEDIDTLRSLSMKGIPDELLMLRALVWKINLGYLPIDSNSWEGVLKEKRECYQLYKSQFLKLLTEEYNNHKYKNKSLLESITKDVYRTHIQFSFFFQPTSKITQLTTEEVKEIYKKRQNCSFINLNDIYKPNTKETHAEVLLRILFIYSKCTPELSYHQGMNELLAPIYYCLSYDKLYKEETEDTIEADAFWCFYYLMKDLKSSFDREDYKNTEYKAKLLGELLKIVDFALWKHITNTGMQFELFAGKWFILLFSQEFEINDVLRLWDLVFTTEDKYYYIFYVALAFFEEKREILFKQDLADMMIEMQTFDNVDIENIIKRALILNKDFKMVIDNKIRIIPLNDKEIFLNAKNKHKI